MRYGMCNSFNTECGEFFQKFNEPTNQPTSQQTNQPTNQQTNQPTSNTISVLSPPPPFRPDFLQYSTWGLTGLSLRKRINIHRSDVRLKKDTAVATHFNSGSCRATHLRVLYLEVLKNTGDITLNKIGRLEVERKWQLALKTYSPFGLNTVPSPKDGGVTPFVITYSVTAVEAASLVTTSFNKLKAKHPNILYKQCVTAFKKEQYLRDLLVRSTLGKAQRLPDPTQVRI